MKYQPTHLANRYQRKLRTAVLAVLVAVLGGTSLAIASPAAAVLPQSAVVTASDDHVKSRCQFTVTSADYAAGTARGRLTAQTAPADWLDAANIAHTSVFCLLYTENYGSFVARISDEDDGPYTYETELVTAPFAWSYELCVTAVYTLRNGTSHSVSNCT